MIDQYERNIDYVRISITDRCNLRCIYCMPEAGVSCVEHQEILRYEEIIKLAEILHQVGIRKVKITGGEPLVRKGAISLIHRLKEECGMESVSITTNGVYLAQYMDQLVEAGIDGINISLDTMDSKRYAQITRRDEFNLVIDGIKKVLEYPNIPLKINCVPMQGGSEDWISVAELARNHAISVRFIEMMPIGLGKGQNSPREVEIRTALEQKFGTLCLSQERLGNGPSQYYTVEGFQGNIGFISAISHKFCSKCNRIRLTAEGYLKTCLQYDSGVNLKVLLRSGASNEEVKNVIEQTIINKPKCHHFLEDTCEEKFDLRRMSQIGG